MKIQPIRQNIYIKNQRKKNVDKSTQPHSTLPSYGLINYPNYFNFKANAPRFKEFRYVMENGSQKAFNECKAQIEKLKNPKDKAKTAIAFIAGLGTTVGYDVFAEEFDKETPYKNMMELIEIASVSPKELVNTMLDRYKLITDQSVPDYSSKNLFFDIDNRYFIEDDLRGYLNGCAREIDYIKINKLLAKEPELLTNLYLGSNKGFGIMHLLLSWRIKTPIPEILENFYEVIKNSPENVNKVDKELKKHQNRYDFFGINKDFNKLKSYIKYSQFVQSIPAETDKDKEAKKLAFNFTYNYVKENPDKFMEDAKKVLAWSPHVINAFLNSGVGGCYNLTLSPYLIETKILKPDSYNKLFKKYPQNLTQRYEYSDYVKFLANNNHVEVFAEFLEIMKSYPKEAEEYYNRISEKAYYYNGSFIFELIKNISERKNLMNAEDMESVVNMIGEIHTPRFEALTMPFNSDGDSLLFKILDIKATDKKSNEALDRIFKKLSQINFSYSYGKNINLDTQDGLGFSFLEKSIFFENERGVKLWRDSSPLGRVYYTPNLDFAVKSCENSDFKNYVLRVLDCKFIDLYEAVKLCSLEAIKKIESQFESPLYTEDSAKDLWDIALHTYNKEFCKDFYKGYQKYLPPNAFDDLMNM